MAIRTLWSALPALLLLGCGSPEAVVTGTVTFNGEPLPSGYITFYPIEGTKATKGGEVTDGAYEIKQMPPGPRRVVVSQTPDVRVVEHKKGPATIKILNSLGPLAVEPPVVEIQPGKQTLDFTLKKAKTPPAR